MMTAVINNWDGIYSGIRTPVKKYKLVDMHILDEGELIRDMSQLTNPANKAD